MPSGPSAYWASVLHDMDSHSIRVVYRGVSSNYEVGSIAINRENTFGVSLSKLAGRLSVR
jgi:hypothetical protein